MQDEGYIRELQKLGRKHQLVRSATEFLQNAEYKICHRELFRVPISYAYKKFYQNQSGSTEIEVTYVTCSIWDVFSRPVARVLLAERVKARSHTFRFETSRTATPQEIETAIGLRLLVEAFERPSNFPSYISKVIPLEMF